MRTIETNEWILLNDIILKIHMTDDDTEMRRFFLNSVRLLVPFDMATFYIADEESPLLMRNPVTLDCPEEAIARYKMLGEKLDYTRWIFMQHKNMVYRESDLYPDPIREELPYYQEIYKPFNIHFSAQVSLVHNETFVGVVSLYRTKDRPDFSESELFILDVLKDHLAFRIYSIAFAAKLIRKKSKRSIDLAEIKSIYKYTDREIELIELMIHGMSNEEISRKLSISSNTVKKHLLNIYKKSGVTNRLQLFFSLTSLPDDA